MFYKTTHSTQPIHISIIQTLQSQTVCKSNNWVSTDPWMMKRDQQKFVEVAGNQQSLEHVSHHNAEITNTHHYNQSMLAQMSSQSVNVHMSSQSVHARSCIVTISPCFYAQFPQLFNKLMTLGILTQYVI